MKNLRYTCFMMICSLLFFGCGKEEVESDEGLIIGEWEGYLNFMVFADGSEVWWQEGGNCRGNIIRFYEDGKLFYTDWVQSDIYPDNCDQNEETPLLGRWERISNGKYIFTLVNALDGSETSITPELVTFNFNGAETMDIRYSELPENAPENAVYYYLILFRQ